MLSHELRNPLAAILSATRLLDDATAGRTCCQEAGRVVERQAKHMTRLLDDLLDVSRITHGRIVLRKELARPARHGALRDRGARAADGRSARLSSIVDDRRTSRCRSSATRRGCSRSRRTC